MQFSVLPGTQLKTIAAHSPNLSVAQPQGIGTPKRLLHSHVTTHKPILAQAQCSHPLLVRTVARVYLAEKTAL